MGTADSDQFAGASLAVAKRDPQGQWHTVVTGIKASVRDGLIGEIPADTFRGAPLWTIRAIVAHESGQTRAANFELDVN